MKKETPQQETRRLLREHRERELRELQQKGATFYVGDPKDYQSRDRFLNSRLLEEMLSRRWREVSLYIPDDLSDADIQKLVDLHLAKKGRGGRLKDETRNALLDVFELQKAAPDLSLTEIIHRVGFDEREYYRAMKRHFPHRKPRKPKARP